MSDVIIVSLISFAGTVLGTLGGILAANKLTTYRIEQLEKKVDKHNNLIDRMYKVEKNVAVMDEALSVANHRISDLENTEKGAKDHG